jgi:drug/metabolite transporter (DMT)-like permease
MESWVLFTFLAAIMQSIRTAGQKKLAVHISPMTTTLVRYLFGLPFAVVYLTVVVQDSPFEKVAYSITNFPFIVYASLASVAQIMATVWLVKVLSFRNFTVGTSFSKTEAVQAAIFGVVFFNAYLSWLGWLAVILGFVGIVILSLPKRNQNVEWPSVFYGVLSGLGFALTALWLREASLSLNSGFIESAAVTLVYMIVVQTIICIVYVAIKESAQLPLLVKNLQLAFFVGATSAFGSIGWYTAMTYENAALVRSLGQIELVFTLMITYLFFKEKVSSKELVGMAAITGSVLTLLLFA